MVMVLVMLIDDNDDDYMYEDDYDDYEYSDDDANI